MSSTFSCALCDVHCSTRQQLQAHEAGKRHIANCFRFSVCNGITVVGQDCSSIPEPKKLTPVKSSLSPVKMSRPVQPETSLRSDSKADYEVNSPDRKTLGSVGSTYCEFCNVQLNSSDQLREHLAGQKHLKKVKSNSSASLQNHVSMVPPDLLGACMDAKHDSALYLTTSRDNASPVNSPVVCSRTFVANCRQYLGPIWPGVTFLQNEADTLVFASELSTDCVLRLEDQNDGWFRVGIHLVTALLTANRDASCDPTSAIWICSKTEVGPDPSLFRSFRFPSTNQRSIQSPTLRVVQLPCVSSNLSEYDLIITDADNMLLECSPSRWLPVQRIPIGPLFSNLLIGVQILLYSLLLTTHRWANCSFFKFTWLYFAIKAAIFSTKSCTFAAFPSVVPVRGFPCSHILHPSPFWTVEEPV
ncbi:hypothetical protein CRM22_006971 [Opisthorchis felineus]|uniref:C2H2-type domain-containing protein n=1 Tax=Opisthorchis felineus TaxID=147828 RepID=A0A4S2LIE9_OPIFE|nr:hypothetical protein CRM22_006971 [Opisthorchis felineus]